MKKNKIHINISTRILLYFLFVTILPLAILALSTTFLMHYSLSEKSEQELLKEVESFQSIYNNVFNEFKSIEKTDVYASLSELLLEKSPKRNISKTLARLRDSNHLHFVSLLDNNFNLISSVSNNKTLILYPLNNYNSDLSTVVSAAKSGNIIVSSEILDHQVFKTFNLKNKIVIKKEKPSDKNFGLLAQIAVLPVYKEKREPSDLLSDDQLADDPEVEAQNAGKHNQNNITEEKQPEQSPTLPPQAPIGYLLVGNFINSNEDISSMLKDTRDLPVNIIQYDYIISSNPAIQFNVTNIFTDDTTEMISAQKYKGEYYINNQWYRLDAYPINNFKGDKIALTVIGLEEDIFRSLKSSYNLLMLQVSILVASGGLVLAFLFTKNISDPISKMRQTVRKIESGDLTGTLEIPAEDELGELARSINEMSIALDARKNEILNYNKILLDQKTKLETIFNYSADGIMTLDGDKKIATINPAIIQWLGEDADYVVGKYFYEVIKFSAEPGKLLDPSIKIENIENLTQIYKYFPDAKINDVELEISFSPMELEKDIEISYVLILRDVTKRKESEELRENFIATLTHDLRTPLIAGVHTLEYLLKGSYGELTDNQKYIVSQLINSNEGLLRMVNTLLDTYSYEAGKHTLVKREINLSKLIIESINELKTLADEKSQEITFNDNVSNCFVIADKQEIKRVIVNLLSNAIIHTSENGKIYFDLKLQESLVIVSITDTGVGLSEKDKERIFNRYSRGGKTLRKIGTGLGLYLSKYIIEAHGGKIWVESELDNGSTFYFTLNLSQKILDEYQNGKTQNSLG